MKKFQNFKGQKLSKQKQKTVKGGTNPYGLEGCIIDYMSHGGTFGQCFLVCGAS